MPSGKWLTPNEELDGSICRPIFIPIDDNLQLMAAVNGALLELTHVWNWEDFGTMSAQNTADLMFELYQAYSLGNCCDECECELPPPFDIDIGFIIRIVRLGDDGHWEELIDGVWSTPTGDYEIPPTDARTEATTEERKCLAAANAVNLLEETYEQATDAFTADATQVAVYEAIIGGLLSALGAWAVGFAASGIGLAFGAFLVFYELLSTVTDDLWTPEFTQDLVCIFNAHATDTAGVISFDYDAILSDIYALQYAAGLDVDTQLLLGQVLFMLSIIGIDGLNVAGGAGPITSYDCGDCGDDCANSIGAVGTSNFEGGSGFDGWSLYAAGTWTGTNWQTTNTPGVANIHKFGTKGVVTNVKVKVRACQSTQITVAVHDGGSVVWTSNQTQAANGCAVSADKTFTPPGGTCGDEIRIQIVTANPANGAISYVQVN